VSLPPPSPTPPLPLFRPPPPPPPPPPQPCAAAPPVPSSGSLVQDNSVLGFPPSAAFAASLPGLALRPFTAGKFNVLAFELSGPQTLTVTYAAGGLVAGGAAVLVSPLALGVQARVLNSTTFTLYLAAAGPFYAQARRGRRVQRGGG
jgi:hypothetical protein